MDYWRPPPSTRGFHLCWPDATSTTIRVGYMGVLDADAFAGVLLTAVAKRAPDANCDALVNRDIANITVVIAPAPAHDVMVLLIPELARMSYANTIGIHVAVEKPWRSIPLNVRARDVGSERGLMERIEHAFIHSDTVVALTQFIRGTPLEQPAAWLSDAGRMFLQGRVQPEAEALQRTLFPPDKGFDEVMEVEEKTTTTKRRPRSTADYDDADDQILQAVLKESLRDDAMDLAVAMQDSILSAEQAPQPFPAPDTALFRAWFKYRSGLTRHLEPDCCTWCCSVYEKMTGGASRSMIADCADACMGPCQDCWLDTILRHPDPGARTTCLRCGAVDVTFRRVEDT